MTQNTTYTFNVRVNGNGGWSDPGTCELATLLLATPANPVCAATLNDSTAPGAITVSGGYQVKLWSLGTVYGSPKYFGGLGAGTYQGYARSMNSDGVNTKYSGWDPCPTRTVAPAPANPPVPAGNAPTNGVWNGGTAVGGYFGDPWALLYSGAKFRVRFTNYWGETSGWGTTSVVTIDGS